MYALRIFRAEDKDFWVALHHEAYRPRVEPIWGWDVALQRNFVQTEIDTRYDGQFVIVVDGGDAGYLSYAWKNDELYVSNIIMRHEWRGKGIGERVMRDLMGWAARLGKNVFLRTFENNPAKAFYERLGFVVYEHNASDHHYYLRWCPPR